MTAETSTLPVTADYKFAYILATIHSAYLKGDVVMTASLLKALPIAMKDPDIADIYYSHEVDEYLDRVYPILYPEEAAAEETPMEDEEEKDEAQEFLDALYDILFGAPDEEEDMENAFKAPELINDVCGNPNCSCAEEDKEELLAETDEFVIVKIWK